MSSTQEDKPKRTDAWREGKWLDLWSLVHFISGTSLGFGFYFLQLGTVTSSFLAFVLLVAYEMWEALVAIEETATNRFMDIVVGMVGFLLAFLHIAPSLSPEMLKPAFGMTLTLNLMLSVVGWRASQKAALLQERMRVRISTQKAQLKKRGVWLREQLHKTPKERK